MLSKAIMRTDDSYKIGDAHGKLMRLSPKQIVLWIVTVGLLLLGMSISGYAQDAPPSDYTLRRIRVPILMYHYVGELPPDADEYRVGLTIRPQTFRDHMVYLRDNGYTPISMYDLDAALRVGAPLPPKPVILTFDDGHLDHYVTVFPILQEFGFTGTFFLVTGFIDNGDPNYITWEMAAEMAAAGMAMESHTKYHPDLRNRDMDFLVYEVLGSIESIEAHVDAPVGIFSYPAGRYDDNTLAVLDETEILRAVTTESGAWHTTDNTLLVTRLRISGDLSVTGLAYLLNLYPEPNGE
jgi:peptidoglycan/xylan/chitin deacetylase (PgdA/CDA1 family)